MGYNGYTEKKKESNKRYLDTRARVVLWLDPEEKQEIERKAQQAGKSVNQFLKDLALTAPDRTE